MSSSAPSPFAAAEQIRVFGDQLESLARRVELLEAKTAAPQVPTPIAGSTMEVMAKRAAEFAQEIFRCPVRMEQDCDPETPAYVWCNFWVTSAADHAAVRDMRQQWYDRIAALELADPTIFRLLVARPS
jgi:hypothetical protein